MQVQHQHQRRRLDEAVGDLEAEPDEHRHACVWGSGIDLSSPPGNAT
jgi:hypothetical protein